MAGTSKSGRKRTPLGWKLLKGSKIRPADRRSARLPAETPTCPTDIRADDLALQYWQDLVARLNAFQILRRTDAEALGRLCLALADGTRLREQFQKTQYRAVLVETITQRDGTVITRPRINPLVRAVTENSRLVRQWLSEFGMTPATLGKIEMSAPAPVDRLREALRD